MNTTANIATQHKTQTQTFKRYTQKQHTEPNRQWLTSWPTGEARPGAMSTASPCTVALRGLMYR